MSGDTKESLSDTTMGLSTNGRVFTLSARENLSVLRSQSRPRGDAGVVPPTPTDSLADRKHTHSSCAPDGALPRLRARLRLRAAALFATSALAALGNCLAAGSFFVDRANPSCSNTGPGTSALPYCTIAAAAAAQGGAGTTVSVLPGVYREQITVPASGAAGNPFVIRALGAPVVIDGSDDFGAPALWTPFAGSVYLAASVTWNPLQVFAGGARLSASLVSPATLPAGTYQWLSGQGLYVNLGGPNPGDRQTMVGRRANGFRLTGKSWVTVEGFTITRTEDTAIVLSVGANNAVIRRNSIAFTNKQGISVSASSGVLVESNTISDCNDHGIYLVSGTSASTVQDNESFRNARPGTRAANGIQLFGSPGNLIQRNRVHDNQDTGLQINAQSNNIICLQNLSWNNGDHGFDHQSSSGTLHIGDVAWRNFNHGFSIITASTATSLFDCIAAENGLPARGYDMFVDATSATGLASNFNILWNSTTQPPVKLGTTIYPTLAGFSAATGQDARSAQADPRFVLPDGGDFHLRAGSPAIDSADSSVASWPAADAEGRARSDDPQTANSGAGPIVFAERGALEFASNAAPHGTIDTPSGAVTLSAGASVTFAGTASDADGPLPLTYLWNFGGGAPSTTVEDPGAVVFAAAGTYTVTFTVTDGLGLADPNPPARVITATSNTPPNGVINTPAANVTIAPCQSISFTGTGSDPDGNLPLSFLWDFGDAAPVQLVEDPGAVAFPLPGVYTVTFTVTDSRRLADPSPDTRIVTVASAAASDEIHWTFTGQTSVAFDWRGGGPTLRYGLTSAYDRTVTASLPMTYPISSCGPFWEAQITGLQENTLYHYAIGTGPDHTFRTPPPRGSSGFMVYAEADIGDAVTFPRMGVVQGQIAADPPAFTLMVGDLTYGNSHGQQFVDQHFNDVMVWSRDAAYMPAWGNHEWDAVGNCSLSTGTACDRNEDCPAGQTCLNIGDDLRNYKGRFHLPNPAVSVGTPAFGCSDVDWYWFDYGNTRFIAYPEPYAPGTWPDWRDRATVLMNQAQADPAVKFIVTFGHRPAYSSGHHPGMANLKAILDALGASHSKYVLNINGHSHNYERSFPQSGVVHLTVGTGGFDLEQDGACLWATCVQPSWSLFRAMHLGPVRLRFSADRIEGAFICGPAGGGTNDITCAQGSIVDSFSIPPLPPNGQIDAPTGPAVTIAAGRSVNFAATAADPNRYVPLSYAWDFGSGAPPRTVEDPGAVVFNTPGTYTVSLTVRNSLGVVDPTPDRRTVVVTARRSHDPHVDAQLPSSP